eukprot:CAMPEP_0198296744 /NCGR_PEP_ID=MMETSP1449-20131203/33748_1 /TAXON_ID=420275 /ORGANISM="Attheya septentrionalis, Strain CCMP2084" /LENGTH=163 /DNA_ID=CAMNT_0043997443 /DNA_START=169 /DNA_END=660 /DNA_ORIENTATION=+
MRVVQQSSSTHLGAEPLLSRREAFSMGAAALFGVALLRPEPAQATAATIESDNAITKMEMPHVSINMGCVVAGYGTVASTMMDLQGTASELNVCASLTEVVEDADISSSMLMTEATSTNTELGVESFQDATASSLQDMLTTSTNSPTATSALEEMMEETMRSV